MHLFRFRAPICILSRRLTFTASTFIIITGLVALLASVATVVEAAATLSPRSTTLAPGAKQQFSAPWASRVRWTAKGGTITSGGLFTAGPAAGSFRVTATHDRSTVNATVVVVLPASPLPAPAPPPPSPPSPAPLPPPPSPAPTTGITLRPGDNIQSWVDAYPAGTIFVLKAGVYARQSIRPKEGMKFIGETGAILDGQKATPRAFVGEDINNVTVSGLRITNYMPPETTGALDAIDTTGWIVENNEIDNNVNGTVRAYGIQLGSTMIVRGNRIHHNGWVGIDGYKCVNTLIEGNDIFMNPPAAFKDTIGEAANIKLYDCGSIIIRNNFVHDSPFRGIWVDTMRPGVTIDGNRVVNHGEAGIWYEVSYRGIISNNYIENAGYNSYYSSGWLRAGGIQVTNSPDVSVLGNTVANSLNGIIGQNANDYADGPYGKSELRNFLVQGNAIVMPRGQSGIVENIDNAAVFTSWNNRFTGNHYDLKTNPTPFYWMGSNLDEWQWQSYGQDPAASAPSFLR